MTSLPIREWIFNHVQGISIIAFGNNITLHINIYTTYNSFYFEFENILQYPSILDGSSKKINFLTTIL